MDAGPPKWSVPGVTTRPFGPLTRLARAATMGLIAWGAAASSNARDAANRLGRNIIREESGLKGPFKDRRVSVETGHRFAAEPRRRHLPKPHLPKRIAAALAALGICLALVTLPSAVYAAGTADEIHYTITGPTSVAFDWRGTATDIRYGTTTSYGSTATSSTPSPLPFSSTGPWQEVQLTGLTAGSTYHYSIGGGTP